MKIGYIDSNIFIRFLIRDIEKQFQKAEKVFSDIEKKKMTGYISILVINEVLWILEKYYELPRSKFIPELIKLIALPNTKVLEQKKSDVLEMLTAMSERKVDFTDVYLVRVADGARVYSFDKDLKKLP